MSESHCPICFTALVTREVAPCYDCGHDPDELRQLASYDPTYFGRPLGAPVGRDMQLVRAIRDPRPTIDKFCPACERRLAFLRFVKQARTVAAA
jgi:hypothetical protein